MRDGPLGFKINQKLLLLMPPDVLSLVITKNLKRNGFHMAIDKNAIVVLAMALGDGVQFSGA